MTADKSDLIFGCLKVYLKITTSREKFKGRIVDLAYQSATISRSGSNEGNFIIICLGISTLKNTAALNRAAEYSVICSALLIIDYRTGRNIIVIVKHRCMTTVIRKCQIDFCTICHFIDNTGITLGARRIQDDFPLIRR